MATDFLPFCMGYLTEEMKEKARIELGETDETKREALAALRKSIKDHELTVPEDEGFLMQYLRPKKFNVKRAFNTLENFLKVKAAHPEIYNTSYFQGVIESCRNKFITILPNRDEHGCALLLIDLEKWNLKEKKVSSALHDLTMSALACVEDPATQVCGLKVILDLRALSMTHLTSIHPKYLLFVFKIMKTAAPIRFKKVYVLTESSIYKIFWNICKHALTSKLRSRAIFLSSQSGDVLLDYMNPDLVPVEYGGNYKFDADKMADFLLTLEPVYLKKMAIMYKKKRTSLHSLW